VAEGLILHRMVEGRLGDDFVLCDRPGSLGGSAAISG